MRSPREFEELVLGRWPFLQSVEESLEGREPSIAADLSKVREEIVTPTSLQHVGEQITEAARADWTSPKALSSTILPYLTELAEFWETVEHRHRRTREVFAAAPTRPYSLLLRTFLGSGPSAGRARCPGGPVREYARAGRQLRGDAGEGGSLVEPGDLPAHR